MYFPKTKNSDGNNSDQPIAIMASSLVWRAQAARAFWTVSRYSFVSIRIFSFVSFSDVIDRLMRREKINLEEYFGAIKDEDLLRGLEEDSKKIRELSRSRV